MHLRWGELCGSAVMCLTGGIHAMDETVLRTSYLNNMISYTDKTKSSYWVGLLSEVTLSTAG